MQTFLFNLRLFFHGMRLKGWAGVGIGVLCILVFGAAVIGMAWLMSDQTRCGEESGLIVGGGAYVSDSNTGRTMVASHFVQTASGELFQLRTLPQDKVVGDRVRVAVYCNSAGERLVWARYLAD